MPFQNLLLNSSDLAFDIRDFGFAFLDPGVACIDVLLSLHDFGLAIPDFVKYGSKQYVSIISSNYLRSPHQNASYFPRRSC